MFVPRIYYPFTLSKNQTITLDKDTSHYVTGVLRLKMNDPVILFNGQGQDYEATIVTASKQSTLIINQVMEVNRESPLHIHLGHGIARSERMDWVVQKSTELGVTTLTPLETQKSIVKLEEKRKEKRQSHWEKIAISAAEQSGRTAVPNITQPVGLKTWASQPFSGKSIYFDTESKTSLKTIAKEEIQQFRIAIGPESGWDEKESSFLREQGFLPFSLGPRILRTETASVTALSLIQLLWGDI